MIYFSINRPGGSAANHRLGEWPKSWSSSGPLLQGCIPAWSPHWFVSETGQITTDSFGSFTVLAGAGFCLEDGDGSGTERFCGLSRDCGLPPHLHRLLDPTASNEYAAGWGLSIALYVGRTTALFAPSMRARFSAGDEDKA